MQRLTQYLKTATVGAILTLSNSLALPTLCLADDTSDNSNIVKDKSDLLTDKPSLTHWQKKDSEPKAMLLCLHELGMYGGIFNNLGMRMAQQGYDVYALDLRGFGGWKKWKHSEGKMNLDKTLVDIKESVEALHKKHPGLPVFVLGEAMGGALALQAASTFPDLIQGTISSAPGGDHYHGRHNYMRVCRHVLVKGIDNKFEMGKELIAAATPRVDVQEAFEKDPEVRLELAPREMIDCQFFMYKTKDMARHIKSSPVLIVQGQKDGETKPQSARDIFENLATSDKQILALADGDHYVYEDPKVNDKAFDGTLSWIESHLKTTK